jgi:hypothetical protein
MMPMKLFFFQTKSDRIQTKDKEFNDAADLVGSSTGLVYCHQWPLLTSTSYC